MEKLYVGIIVVLVMVITTVYAAKAVNGGMESLVKGLGVNAAMAAQIEEK
jgi:hypothetical protein